MQLPWKLYDKDKNILSFRKTSRMKFITILTKSNKTHTIVQIPTQQKKKNEKKDKIFLSSLFNNYTHISAIQITNKNIIHHIITTDIREKRTTNNRKRTLLWLGKEYDTNSLYPWTQQQLKMSNPILHIQKNTHTHNTLSFYTHKRNRIWRMPHTWNTHFFHYKITFLTNNMKNSTKQQLSLKHIRKNNNIKNTINNLYGKWRIKTIKQNNNIQSIRIIEHRKLKLQKTIHITKKKIDSKNTQQKREKKRQKNKTGYQKNEFLNSWILLKDNFKICNLIHNKNSTNKIHIQQHRKLKY